MKLIMYLIETIVCSGILYLFYRLFLDRKASFNVCRAYLMTAIIISAVIPALRIPVYAGDVIEVSGGASSIMMPLIGESDAAQPVTMNYSIIVAVLYGIGAMTAIAFLIYHAIRIGRFKRNAGVGHTRFYTLYESRNIETPFSYFRSIFIPSGYSKTELAQIISHEISHIRHHHTEELILMEILKSLFWFNPFVWMVRRTLTEVHEYQADRDALNTGCDPETYRILVFKQLFGCNPDLTSGLNHSRTKKRLIMMTKKSTGRHTLLRTAAVLPVLATLVMLFGFTKQSPVYIEVDPQQGNNAVPEEIISVDHIDFKTNKAEDRAFPDKKNKRQKSEIPDSVSIIINGKSIDKQQLEKLDPDQIESISVLKGQAAITVHGEDGKNGVIHITVKKVGDSETIIGLKSDEAMPHNVVTGTILEVKSDTAKGVRITKGQDNDHLIIIDGERADKEKMENLSPSQTKSISVLKGQSAAEVYGKEGENGVIIITTKQADK